MNAIESAQAELNQAVGRMLSLIEITPDDKLFWKPSPSARSIGEIAAHTASAIGNIAMQLRGIPFPVLSSREANVQFLAHDSGFTEREQVVSYLNAKHSEYQELLSTFTLEDLEGMRTLPFGLGQAPLGYFMTMGAAHTQGHIPQIEYIQTLYGDHDWHTGF